jgi:phage terminase Nu1 subunit (DNA packaging protein)
MGGLHQHKEMADKLEMENMARRAELVPGNEVAALWRSLASEVRRRLMLILDRVVVAMSRTNSSTEVEKVIDREIRDGLADLSESPNELPNRK